MKYFDSQGVEVPEEVVNSFLGRLPERISKLESAVAEMDWDQIKLLSHKLAGAGLFGFALLANIGAAIEEVAKDQDAEILPHLMAALALGFQRVKQECQL